MLDGLFPADVITAWGDPADPSGPLFPEEEALVARAFPKRRQEFAKGRECARAALSSLGLPDVMLLAGGSREPLWPADVVGSITHTRGLCAVAVARSERYAGLGIDAELAEPMEEAVARRVRRDDELTPPEGLGSLEAAIVPKLVFSAKEAVYKCLFPILRTYLGFKDVSVTLDQGTFRVRLHVATPLAADAGIVGQWRRLGAHLVTAAWIDRSR